MSVCDMSTNQDGGVTMIVDRNTAAVQAWSVYSCQGPNSTTFDIESNFQWVIPSSGDDVLYGTRMGTMGPPVYDVLARLSQDLLEAILIPPSPRAEPFVRVGVASIRYCPAFQLPDGTTPPDHNVTQKEKDQCARDPVNITLTEASASWMNGSSSLMINTTDLGAVATPAITNFLNAFMAATDMDLGINKPNSLYFNMSIFNDNIIHSPSKIISHFVPTAGDANLTLPYGVYGAHSSTANNLTNAEILSTYPDIQKLYHIPMNHTFKTPAIINISYLCHDYRRKTTTMFISSVFVGTASMFMAWRGPVLYVATILAQRRRQEVNDLEASPALGQTQFQLKRGSSRSSRTMYELGPLRDSKTDLQAWSKDAWDAVSPKDRGSGYTESVGYSAPSTKEMFNVALPFLGRVQNVARCLAVSNADSIIFF
ncbi:hypothetical protein JAAARDRAFT_193229 [Jaapia argillacea MUCL 33604]|uniref:Uncharacterized protein n=1 Tax=Jaapia argillacea MUCL 33604 TaxID=933084 RepID=A0A067Q7X1_9AGAM|nr:hypothetical protein JAAARDRAFT_193229 [Jaapia argillacea MUCL 33604]